MSEVTDKLYPRGNLGLTIVNGLLLFVVFRQSHLAVLQYGELPEHGSSIIHSLLHMPSVLVMLLALILLALLIGKEWLRPRWLPLVLNLAGLVGGSCVLIKLHALLA